jgi:hypothetical protein
VAPRQFSPLIPYLSFGWLPAGESLNQGGIRPTESYMAAGHLGPDWTLDVYARGQCHLTGSASGLNCPGSSTLPIRQRAPDVAGHRAFWYSPGLVWQYARGGWAVLGIPAPNLSAVLHSKELAGQALKIARNVRYGMPTRLVFPARVSGLPSQWQVHNISYYVPDGGLLRADEYMLTTGSSRFHPRVGDTGVWTDAPYIMVHPSPRKGTCTPHDPASQNTSEIINGYRVVLKRMRIGGFPCRNCVALTPPVSGSTSKCSVPTPPSTWPPCSGTTCGCSAPTRRTGPETPSGEQAGDPVPGPGPPPALPARPACGEALARRMPQTPG